MHFKTGQQIKPIKADFDPNSKNGFPSRRKADRTKAGFESNDNIIKNILLKCRTWLILRSKANLSNNNESRFFKTVTNHHA